MPSCQSAKGMRQNALRSFGSDAWRPAIFLALSYTMLLPCLSLAAKHDFQTDLHSVFSVWRKWLSRPVSTIR